METKLEPITAEVNKIRAILSERGLPAKMAARLTTTENKIHTILCSSYNFTKGIAELEMPAHLLNQCGDEIRKIWTIHTKYNGVNRGKVQVFFTLTQAATKQTIKTALVKDESIFNGKTDQTLLHKTWARFLQHKATPGTATPKTVDWSKAERAAQAYNEHTKQAINDGKTFNAQKDNPWARKNLKNKGQ